MPGAGQANGGRGHHHGGGGLMQEVMQTLNQLGLGPTAAPSSSSTLAGQDTSGSGGSTATTGVADVGQAMHAFMHDLFQTLNQSSVAGATTGAAATGAGSDGDGDGSGSQGAGAAGPYANFTQQLGALIQNLNSGTGATATQGTGSDLNAAFQNLVQALDANGGSSASASNANSNQQVSLQAFLQDLMQNLQSNGNQSPSSVGGTLSSAA